MVAEKKTLLDKPMMDRKHFMGLFPWKKIVKLHALFLLYIILCGVLFFSLEECLNDKYSKPIYEQKNVTPLPTTNSNISHVVQSTGVTLSPQNNKENNTEEESTNNNISHVVQSTRVTLSPQNNKENSTEEESTNNDISHVVQSIGVTLSPQNNKENNTEEESTNNNISHVVQSTGVTLSPQNNKENSTEEESTNNNISHVVQSKKCTMKESRKCEITGKRVMKWMYFTVVHLHGADTSGFHLTSKWGQIMMAPILAFGLVLVMQLYALTGFVQVNMINYAVLKLRQRLKKFTTSVKYDILAIASAEFIIYVLTCGYVSSLYAGERTTYRESVFRWAMLLFTVADENLLEELWTSNDDSKSTFSVIFIVITLMMIGYHVTSALFASFVNSFYRLTYNLNTQTKHKKGAMQGWWV